MDLTGFYTGDKLFDQLHHALSQALPGVEEQLKLAPAGRIRDIFSSTPSQPVRSSVMIVCYLRDGEPSTLFIRRPEYPGIHSGQIAFPGGRFEEHDHDNQATAIRETEEETGIQADIMKVAGALTPLYIPPSNYMVYPYVAVIPPDPIFKPDPAEVAELVEVPLSRLLDPQTVRLMPPSPDFIFMEVPAYVIDNAVIWGATAMITAEFTAVLRKVLTVGDSKQ